MALATKTNFYLVKRWFWSKNQLFPRKKMVFLRQSTPKPSFCEGKVGFPMENRHFTRQNQKTIFFNIPSPFSKTDGFIGFSVLPRKRCFGAKNQLLPRKKMVFLRQTRPKQSFYEGKVGFPMENHLFTRQNQKNHLFQHPLPIL